MSAPVADPPVQHMPPGTSFSAEWTMDGNPILGYSKLKNCVRLLFWSGQSFDEDDLKPEGKFKAAEARFTAAEQVDVKALKRWLKKASEIQ